MQVFSKAESKFERLDARDLNTYGFQNLMDQLPSQGYMEDNSKQRMRAACELTDAEKPQPCITVDQTKFQSVYDIESMSPSGEYKPHLRLTPVGQL